MNDNEIPRINAGQQNKPMETINHKPNCVCRICADNRRQVALLAAKELPSAYRPAETSSGFAVVGRHLTLGYTPVTTTLLARGFLFEELWIFGKPETPTENDLWKAVAVLLCYVPTGMIHRI